MEHPKTVFELSFYRRTIQDWELTSTRLFANEESARRVLRLHSYKLLEHEEFVYRKGDLRVVLAERTIE